MGAHRQHKFHRGEVFFHMGNKHLGHPLSGCPCTAAAKRHRQQQDVCASQPMTDNYASVTDTRTDEHMEIVIA